MKDREDGHGEVMITVSKSIPSMHLPNLDASCEILWVKPFINTSKDIYAAAFYRPDVSDLSSIEEFSVSLEKLRNFTQNP